MIWVTRHHDIDIIGRAVIVVQEAVSSGWLVRRPNPKFISRRRVAAKVRRVHHLVGEDIDDPGAQYGTDSRTRDISLTALGDRPGPSRTRKHLDALQPASPNLAKSLSSVDQIVRLPHPDCSSFERAGFHPSVLRWDAPRK